jgi:hypothetical protein
MIQVQRTFKGIEAKARKALAEFITEGLAPEADRRTFGQLLDEWVELRAGRWAPKTFDEAKREIENRIRPRLGAIRVAKLTSKYLDDAYSAWAKVGRGNSSIHRFPSRDVGDRSRSRAGRQGSLLRDVMAPPSTSSSTCRAPGPTRLSESSH